MVLLYWGVGWEACLLGCVCVSEVLLGPSLSFVDFVMLDLSHFCCGFYTPPHSKHSLLGIKNMSKYLQSSY